jgi:hypothetical protein
MRQATRKENMSYKYRVTIGDINGVANTIVTDSAKSAEDYAQGMLGREWGKYRDITVATVYEWGDTGYTVISELEF